MKSSYSFADALGHGPADKRIEILRLIGKSGSISQAARDAKVSYKAAWQAIDTLTNLAGISLVEKMVGGAGGGGARLTEAGAQLLATATMLEKIRHEVLHQLRGGNTVAYSSTVAQLAIRTSMRNHLPCSVVRLEDGGQIVRVILQLQDGEQFVSRITRTSAELLALRPGQPVLALFKAAAVEIHGAHSAAVQGRNCLEGKVVRISGGNANDEISISLPAGLQLVGFSPAGHVCQPGDTVVAVMDESAIVIALAD